MVDPNDDNTDKTGALALTLCVLEPKRIKTIEQANVREKAINHNTIKRVSEPCT